MSIQPIEVTLSLSPKSRLDIVDVAAKISKNIGVRSQHLTFKKHRGQKHRGHKNIGVRSQHLTFVLKVET